VLGWVIVFYLTFKDFWVAQRPVDMNRILARGVSNLCVRLIGRAWLPTRIRRKVVCPRSSNLLRDSYRIYRPVFSAARLSVLCARRHRPRSSRRKSCLGASFAGSVHAERLAAKLILEDQGDLLSSDILESLEI